MRCYQAFVIGCLSFGNAAYGEGLSAADHRDLNMFAITTPNSFVDWVGLDNPTLFNKLINTKDDDDLACIDYDENGMKLCAMGRKKMVDMTRAYPVFTRLCKNGFAQMPGGYVAQCLFGVVDEKKWMSSDAFSSAVNLSIRGCLRREQTNVARESCVANLGVANE